MISKVLKEAQPNSCTRSDALTNKMLKDSKEWFSEPLKEIVSLSLMILS